MTSLTFIISNLVLHLLYLVDDFVTIGWYFFQRAGYLIFLVTVWSWNVFVPRSIRQRAHFYILKHYRFSKVERIVNMVFEFITYAFADTEQDVISKINQGISEGMESVTMYFPGAAVANAKLCISHWNTICKWIDPWFKCRVLVVLFKSVCYFDFIWIPLYRLVVNLSIVFPLVDYSYGLVHFALEDCLNSELLQSKLLPLQHAFIHLLNQNSRPWEQFTKRQKLQFFMAQCFMFTVHLCTQLLFRFMWLVVLIVSARKNLLQMRVIKNICISAVYQLGTLWLSQVYAFNFYFRFILDKPINKIDTFLFSMQLTGKHPETQFDDIQENLLHQARNKFSNVFVCATYVSATNLTETNLNKTTSTETNLTETSVTEASATKFNLTKINLLQTMQSWSSLETLALWCETTGCKQTEIQSIITSIQHKIIHNTYNRKRGNQVMEALLNVHNFPNDVIKNSLLPYDCPELFSKWKFPENIPLSAEIQNLQNFPSLQTTPNTKEVEFHFCKLGSFDESLGDFTQDLIPLNVLRLLNPIVEQFLDSGFAKVGLKRHFSIPVQQLLSKQTEAKLVYVGRCSFRPVPSKFVLPGELTDVSKYKLFQVELFTQCKIPPKIPTRKVPPTPNPRYRRTEDEIYTTHHGEAKDEVYTTNNGSVTNDGTLTSITETRTLSDLSNTLRSLSRSRELNLSRTTSMSSITSSLRSSEISDFNENEILDCESETKLNSGEESKIKLNSGEESKIKLNSGEENEIKLNSGEENEIKLNSGEENEIKLNSGEENETANAGKCKWTCNERSGIYETNSVEQDETETNYEAKYEIKYAKQGESNIDIDDNSTKEENKSEQNKLEQDKSIENVAVLPEPLKRVRARRSSSASPIRRRTRQLSTGSIITVNSSDGSSSSDGSLSLFPSNLCRLSSSDSESNPVYNRYSRGRRRSNSLPRRSGDSDSRHNRRALFPLRTSRNSSPAPDVNVISALCYRNLTHLDDSHMDTPVFPSSVTYNPNAYDSNAYTNVPFDEYGRYTGPPILPVPHDHPFAALSREQKYVHLTAEELWNQSTAEEDEQDMERKEYEQDGERKDEESNTHNESKEEEQDGDKKPEWKIHPTFAFKRILFCQKRV